MRMKMKQPKLMRSYNIEESSCSSDDDSIGTINTNDIELLDDCSDNSHKIEKNLYQNALEAL